MSNLDEFAKLFSEQEKKIAIIALKNSLSAKLFKHRCWYYGGWLIGLVNTGCAITLGLDLNPVAILSAAGIYFTVQGMNNFEEMINEEKELIRGCDLILEKLR